MRAESDYVDRQAPKVAESRFTPTRPSHEEIQAYCLEKGWTDVTKSRRIAKRYLVQDQEEIWREEMKNVKRSSPVGK
jgi:hypothetical protein